MTAFLTLCQFHPPITKASFFHPVSLEFESVFLAICLEHINIRRWKLYPCHAAIGN